jgi:D-beta-D-heptose 7-phosphate kinase/D-beta-D-heptose 1-phosphate adenosyltransferase
MNLSRVNQLLPSTARVLVVGEMILDEFIWGKVSRISPEAPVPVLDVVEESFHAGGAANVARNLRELITDVQMLGPTGVGPDADRLRSLLVERGIVLHDALHDPAYQTIRKTRIVARTQQLVRVDREQKRPPGEASRERAIRQFVEVLPQLDAVIFEDYDKGLFDQSFADALVQAAKMAKVPVLVDPKPSNPVRWRGVTGITPNRGEAFRAAGVPWSEPVEPPLADAALAGVGARLLQEWECAFVLVTLSEQGMMLFQHNAEPYHIPTRAQEVFDVSGAGDTSIAVFTAALAGGATPVEAAEISNHAAGIVVGKLGTATVTRAELLASFPVE